MLEQDNNFRQEQIMKYRFQIEPLLPYIPWFEKKVGNTSSRQYSEERFGESTMRFPVYDRTLMDFIRTVESLEILDRNYVYVYSRNQLSTVADELKFIEETDLSTAENLHGILSKYIIKGRTKSQMWSLGVETGIYLTILKKWKSILDIWDQPLI